MPIISMLPTSGIPDQVIEQNKGAKQKFWVGTKAELDAVAERDANTLYIVTDDAGSVGGGDELKAHLEDKNNPHGVTAEQAGAMPLAPVQINDTDNVLNLAPGRYCYEGNSDKQTTEMNLPSIAWHWEITVIASSNVEGTTNNYKVVLAVNSASEVYRNVLAWDTWGGWNKIATVGDLANYLPLSGGTMTGALCVGKHARLSEAAGDSWGTFTLDSAYGDGFARLALICYGAGSDPVAIVQLFKENGELVKQMGLIHDGNIGSQTVNKANYASITDPGTASLKNIKAGTSDLTAGSSTLTTGDIYLVYE